jgi:hypothetical protein
MVSCAEPVAGATIVILNVLVSPHCPEIGVNVNNVVPSVAVFIFPGFHVPVIPFIDVNGNTGAVEF